MTKSLNNKKTGLILPGAIVFASVAVVIIVALVSWFVVVQKASRILYAREQAFHFAESGVEYYRWHLAHSPEDYHDGTTELGPYVHNVYDREGNVVGSFSLNIIPPQIGTTVVTIESTGKSLLNDDISRIIRVKLAKPSFARFAFVSNSDMRFGAGTEIFGPIHSNGGIRFDGIAHNLISSAKEVYNDPDHDGENEFGVHTHVSPLDPLPPNTVPDRLDVFIAGREFPVPTVDFTSLTKKLSDLKELASSDNTAFSESGGLGYRVVLKVNDTFDLYRVTSFTGTPDSSCTNSANQDGWGTWSIQNNDFIANYNFPEKGVIFFDDNVWVEGQINTARLTIAAARFPDVPSTNRSITVNNDLLYTNYDGQDVLALIAQNNINVGLYSDTDLRIDAALVAQNGRIGRYYYRPPFQSGFRNYPGCSNYHSRNSITLLGMLATNKRYGFAYTDGTGYINRSINYDTNLLYGPPPQFPLTSTQYEQISWEEI